MPAAGIELNLPDLPEVPIRIGADAGAAQPRARLSWDRRLRELLVAYLPLLLMVLLALGTWWLVKNSPQPVAVRAPIRLTGEPDYTMRGFTLQRFAREGPLRVLLEGQRLHHYPDGDRLEIEELRLTAFGSDGRQTLATARKAVANGRGSEAELRGGAQIRGYTTDGQPLEIDSEFLRYQSEPERVSTDRAVRVRVGANRMTAGGLIFDKAAQRLELKPPIRMQLQPPVPK